MNWLSLWLLGLMKKYDTYKMTTTLGSAEKERQLRRRKHRALFRKGRKNKPRPRR